MEGFIVGVIAGLVFGIGLMRNHKQETIYELLDKIIEQRWRILELERENAERVEEI